MPQLKSGRHVALSASQYLDALSSGSDESRYFAIVALRLNCPTPEALRDHLVVFYFDETKGTPPNAPTYSSGYCLADILQNRANWSTEEVEDFRNFLTTPRFGPWLQDQFDELSQTIQNNQIWGAELLESNPESNEIDVSMLKRAIILKSAMQPDAMAQLRAVR